MWRRSPPIRRRRRKDGRPCDFGYIARFSVVFCGLWLVTLLGFLPELRSANIETGGSAAPSGKAL